MISLFSQGGMYIDLPGLRVAYKSRGEGVPLLLIHGFPLNRGMWRPQIGELSKQAWVLAPDLRGHGESTATEPPYTMDMLADDCVELLRAVGVEIPAVVCGLSMGGYITLAMYRRHPDQIGGLVLAATRASADTPEGKANRKQAIDQAKAHGAAAIAASMVPKMLSPKRYKHESDLVQRIENMIMQTSTSGIIGALEGMMARPDSTPMLGAIDVPVIIIHGEDDQLIPFHEAETMHSVIRGSTLHVIPGAGHLPNLEQPNLFNRIVGDFLKRIA